MTFVFKKKGFKQILYINKVISITKPIYDREKFYFEITVLDTVTGETGKRIEHMPGFKL